MRLLAALDKALPNKWLQLALVIAVVLTLWAFLQEGDPKVELVEPTAALADNRTRKQASNTKIIAKQDAAFTAQNGMVAWENFKRVPLQGKVENPFRVHSWLVVPPIKKVKPILPPAPVAPPAPFTYMGKYEETPSSVQIFLMANGKLYAATQGKNIDTQWRLDSEDANSLRLTYLPLNLPQVLSKAAQPMMPAVEPVSAEMNL